jgi:hypothetical protein
MLVALNAARAMPNQSRYLRYLLILALALLCEPVIAVRLLCVAPGIVVEGEHAAAVKDACDAIKNASPFLEKHHLTVPANLEIELDDSLAREHLGPCELGRFDGKTGKILMRNCPSRQSGSLSETVTLTTIESRPIWRSYIVHEFTHAAMWETFTSHRPTPEIFEYVAAVAQLTSLPEAMREDLLAQHASVGAFENESEITLDIFLLNPQHFAVMAYKHYQLQNDPPAFLRKLMER